MDSLLYKALLARVYDVAIESPLQKAAKLSAERKVDVYLKREDLQPIHSFKLRGAYNKMCQLTDKEREAGVIAASAGNHAQGVALASKRLGLSALIIMPRTTPSIKVKAVKEYGADIELYGDSYSDAYAYAMEQTLKTGRTLIHPFDDPLVIAGQGTIAHEIITQLPNVTHVFVPIGGGGLIAGVAQFIKKVNPAIRVIGVEPEDSNAMQQSLAANRIVSLGHVGIFADGVAVKEVGEHTFTLCKQYVAEIITVSTDQICAGIKAIFEDTRAIVEPAGALSVAALSRYELPPGASVVAICSGANMTFERLQQITERTLIGSGKEALFNITLPETPGALLSFCNEVVNDHSITEFSYRFRSRTHARIFIGIAIADEQDKKKFTEMIYDKGYHYTDLSDDDVAKNHVRHMIGGGTSIESEHFYEISFPERPRALADFLKNIGSKASITLFHYRSTASDTSNVLIGFETRNIAQLEHTFALVGFEFKRVEDSPSLQAFIAV